MILQRNSHAPARFRGAWLALCVGVAPVPRAAHAHHGAMPTLPSRRGPDPLLGGALLGAGLVGAAWLLDARRRREEARLLHRNLVDLLLNTLSSGDEVTARHSRRVADLTDALADALRLPRGERATLRVAALLHDMGKVDDRFFHILHSRRPLTDQQRAEIKRHPHESADILQPLERTHPGLTCIVSSHHECWNGSGYPRGLSRDEIPLAARVIAVADVYDALTQPRTYRGPLEPEDVLGEIREGAGSQFDPEIVKLLDRPEVWREWREIARRGREEEEAHRAEGEATPAAPAPSAPRAGGGA